jgi:hypothetical protein
VKSIGRAAHDLDNNTKYTLNKENERGWTGFIWLRIAASDILLYTQQ